MRLIINLSTYFFVFFLFFISSITIAETTKNIQQEIKKLGSRLQNDKQQSQILQLEVRSLEKQLGRIGHQKYLTKKKIEKITQRLIKANKKKQSLDIVFQIQKTALAQQLQAFHTAGTQSHLRLLLRQDNPSDITRTFKYFEYLYENRAKKIKSIKEMLRKIDSLKHKIGNNKNKLQQLRHRYNQQERSLQITLAKRAKGIKKLSKSISNKEKKLNRLKKEEARLQSVVERIAKRAEKFKIKKQKKTHRISTKNKAKVVLTSFTPNKPFSTLRGRLTWPVKGKIIHAYRTKRNEKQRWRGVVIKAPGGRKVRAIAKGRIGFSGWMNGYGYIIMIEHDRNYISVYGYNRAVYKKEGTIVKANEVIAVVGSSGGQNQSALYFEIRKGKFPQNPARWCR